jgi:colanic acid biosynthesis glycosyl transferase WcaI
MHRILVHDFSGHPFQAQLSRELARRGHEVRHVHCDSYVSGRGNVTRTADDPPTLSFHPVSLDEPFNKYSPRRRFQQEVQYGKRFASAVSDFGPDVVIESNDPLLAKAVSARRMAKAGIPWVFWLQDLYSVAMAGELEERLRAPGKLLGKLPRAIEGRLLRRCAAVVPITPDFDERLDAWRVDRAKRQVIPNWAPLDEIRPVASGKSWAVEQGIDSERIVLYGGTLGLKHDPSLLLDVARAVEPQGATVVVVSEGAGADWLAEHGADQANLVLRPFQPYERLSEMFASADVGLTLLNADAGVFSVPSKLLSYLCAGRPVVAAVPAVNQAARVIEESGAGAAVAADDPAALCEAVVALLGDADRREAMGAAGRQYAEAHFDIVHIGDQFLEVIERTVTGRPRSTSSQVGPAA